MSIARILIRIALILGVAGMPAFAQQAHAPWSGLPRRARDAARSEAVARRLKLSDAQRNAIQALRSRYSEKLKLGRRDFLEARGAFRLVVRDPQAKIEELRSLHQTMAERRFEMLRIRRTMKEEMRTLLSPEPREEAARDSKAGRS